jgi:outer membrane protein insertion porin family
MGHLIVPDSGLAQLLQKPVKSIDVVGNQRIETLAILDRVTLKIGEILTRAITQEQIRLIYDMGFFDDVEVQTESVSEGIKVVFAVREKPFTSEIVFDGNDHLSDDKLQELITLQSQVFLDQQQIKVSVQKIREAYEADGYNNAQIIPIVQGLDGVRNRVTFFIKEEEQAQIRDINFEGMTVYKRSDVLGVMANREWVPIVSWITDAGVLRREELPNDVERIKELYANKGYLDVQVGLPVVELSDDKESFAVTFSIVEGQPYIVESIEFQGNEVFTEEEIKVDLSLVPGDVFQRGRVRDEITRVTDLYGKKGYAFTEVIPSLIPNPQNLTTRISFTINEGKLIRVREVRISGNDKTRDNVIRREIRVDEQEVLDSVAIKRSFQRLNNLNFFETVEILPQQVESDKVDLEVKVKEKPTGAFSIGGGFSTLDLFTLIANISEGNLFGLGYMARIQGQLGGRRTLGVLTFRNPRLYDGPVSFQADAYSTDTDLLTYEEKKKGGTLTFGRQLSEYLSGSITLVAESIKISNIDSDAPEFVEDQEGTQSTTGFRASLFRDSRDNFQDPRSGSRVGVRGNWGSDLFGGTNNFVSFTLDGLKYTPIPFWDLRWSIRGRVGAAEGYKSDDVPLTELFFVGGINTVRGFKFGRAGPVTDSNDPEGATKQFIINNDLIFPILPEAKFNGVLFFDYGKGFGKGEKISTDLRDAAGLEIRWISPFGPLRAALGKNLDPKDGEKKVVFEFSVGNVF